MWPYFTEEETSTQKGKSTLLKGSKLGDGAKM